MDRQMKFPIIALALGMVVVALGTAQPQEGGGGPPPPPARKIPGINAEDIFPNACVDCHVVIKEANVDARFSTHIAKWKEGAEPKLVELAKAASVDASVIKGVHPEAAGTLDDIPNGCLACHTKDSNAAPPFARFIHLIHFTGGDESPFFTFYQGECTHCHKFNAKNGEWSIPSAPGN